MNIHAIRQALQSERLTYTSLPDETGVLMDIEQNQILSLNDTANFIIEQILANKNSIAELVEAMIAEFEVDPDQAEQDIMEFLQELEQLIQ